MKQVTQHINAGWVGHTLIGLSIVYYSMKAEAGLLQSLI
tara:strand:- start:799 stop:915 length:117 start_codon:yes stop_codon:yes gene_type:complete